MRTTLQTTTEANCSSSNEDVRLRLHVAASGNVLELNVGRDICRCGDGARIDAFDGCKITAVTARCFFFSIILKAKYMFMLIC